MFLQFHHPPQKNCGNLQKAERSENFERLLLSCRGCSVRSDRRLHPRCNFRRGRSIPAGRCIGGASHPYSDWAYRR